MSDLLSQRPRLWQTVWLLLRAAWKRSLGQQRRQRQLLRSRGGGVNLGGFGYLISAAFGIAVHIASAVGLITAVYAAERIGRFAIGQDFAHALSFGRLPSMVGSILLLWWFLMLVCQGEGIELDLQRRRHPMWEWLFSHPVTPAAVFIAEMLSPLVANPLYLTAPLYPGILYGTIHGGTVGILAALLIGIPITLAAAFLGKAVEIAVMLRFSLRVRGAVLGLLGWFGYSSMLLLLISGFAMAGLIAAIGDSLEPLATVPWPWLGLMLGEQSDGSFSFAAGMLACWLGAGVMATAAVWFSVWGAGRGLLGETGRSQPVAVTSRGVSRFIRNPLYRKELLWFRRDPSAVIQTILIPLTLAGFQLLNLRGAVHTAQSAWNVLCAAAILFGTYFLWVLGPRSLASEGAALWIALSWPPGLENLLKAKARLWTVIASTMVGLVLCYAAIRFPEKLAQIALVGVGWCLFARSMAEKSVTLVTVTSSSGEIQRVPRSRYWATQLGMVTFAVGVLAQQWTVALTGIVYSAVTAAAMWQNLRARLPYLYDPWSERLPDPPTLMHVMIAISLAVDFGAIVIGIVAGVGGSAAANLYRPTVFGFSGVAAAIGLVAFLYGRGVTLGDVVTWRTAGAASLRGRLSFLLIAIVGGLLLGMAARLYLALLQSLPFTSELVPRQAVESTAAYWAFALGGVLFAPLGEEYLFRGVLFRALDREWSGWQAVLGSAAFFAIYHPPIAWLPVGLVGVLNALLFKRSGWLVAPMALHMTYNATMLMQ